MERTEFFTRITRALGSTVRVPGPVPTWKVPGELLIEDLEERTKEFMAINESLGTIVRLVSDRQSAKTDFQALMDKRNVKKAVSSAPLADWLGGYASDDWADADFGICEADYGQAETGAVVLLTGGDHPRSISLLPKAVGFVVPKSKILNRLTEVLPEIEKMGQAIPSCVNFICGPSKTADIELDLCIGVHGPGEVYVWVVDNE